MLKVNDMYATIQGEGCMTGVPMVLVRLQGCPVGCLFCDTKETWDCEIVNLTTFDKCLGTNKLWCNLTPKQVADEVAIRAGAIKWVLITGGEPAIQDLRPLVNELTKKGFLVALETSGTATGHIGAGFHWVCVSPKIDMPGGLKILKEAVQVANEIKYVIGTVKDINKLKEGLKEWDVKKNQVICLQPMSMNVKATQLCVAQCLEMGWRLSIQTHKIADVR